MQITVSKLDPRSKLCIVLCLSTLGILIQDVHFLSAVLLLSVFITMTLGCNMASVIKRMRRIVMLFIAIAIIQSIFSPSGTVLISFWNRPLITEGGLISGLVMVLRMAIVVVSAVIMTTSSSREIVQGFVQLKVPYEIAFMVSVAIRFLPILSEEIQDTLVAIQLRGVELKRIPVKKRLRVYSYILLPVVLSTIIKSRDLSTAMEMRAFRAYPQRTSYLMLRMSRRDYAVIGVSLIASLSFIIFYYAVFI